MKLNQRSAPMVQSRRARHASGQFRDPALRLASRTVVERLEARTLLSEATNYLLPQHELVNIGSYLTSPSKKAPLTIAQSYLAAHAGELGLTADDVADTKVTNQYTDPDTGTTHIYLRQTYNDFEIANANLVVNVADDGRIINVGGGFVSNLQSAAVSSKLKLDAPAALKAISDDLGLEITRPTEVTSKPQGLERRTIIQTAQVSEDPIPAKLQYVATANGLVLAWDMILRTPDGEHWYNVSSSADTGKLVASYDWVEHASYTVFPQPLENPDDGPRQTLNDPFDPVASPFGWQDTNGVAGAEFTDTRGNNVSAQDDTNADNAGGLRPDAGPSLNFNFPLDLTQPPSGYQSAAITNLFYWNNLLHDVHYQYGFTEAAGNFQINNYGRGGSGNDAVQADAQDGSGTNNANFATPPDGSAPRMQMYIFSAPNPDRDGDLDSGIITHEYGHGVSNRLTGGPANSNALSAQQSGGMGEGWSDWWAMMFTQKPTDVKNQAYPMGNYALGQAPTGPGIRRQPYSYNMSIDPITLAAYNSNSEVHAAGEIWASTLWDMTWLLIDKYGYSANIAGGYAPGAAGNILALKLVMDALKLQPANPTFLNARDAILQADTALSGGADLLEIWTAFARRGMGLSASAGANANSLTVTPAFDMPILGLQVLTTNPAVGAILSTPPTDFVVNFSSAYTPASVDASDFKVNGIAADSFVLNDSDTITFHFNSTPVTSQGQQSMSIAAGAMTKQSDSSASVAFTGSFRYDAVTMQVTATNPANGSGVALPLTQIDVTFNEPYDPASLSAADLTISQGSVVAGLVVNSTTVRYTISGVTSEGVLNLSLAAGALTDTFGNPMQAYAGTLNLDIGTVPFPAPLVARSPKGTLIYSGQTTAANLIGPPGDNDSFTLGLDPGQTLTILVTPTATLRPTIELRDPSNVLIGTATATAAGTYALLQTGAVAVGGVYKITVGGAASTSGTYTVKAFANTALEAEQYGGATNDSRASAQDIGASFTSLGGGASRGAVVGNLPSSSATQTIVSDDFETGVLSSAWTKYSSDASLGRIQLSGANGTGGGAYAMLMDHNDSVGTTYNLNEAVWTVNLAGLTQATLSFSHTSYSDEDDALPVNWVGHANGDGVSISADGNTWYRVWQAVSGTGGVYSAVSVDLSAAATTAGISLGSNFKVKFQQYDNYNIGTDGRGWDSVAITTPAPPLNPNDYYSFTLNAGDSASIGISKLSGSGETIALLDSSGNVVASGAAPASTSIVDQAINSFVAATGGTYYVRVTGGNSTEYTLVVTRNATFDQGSNQTVGTAQNVAGASTVLGSIGQSSGSAGRLYALDSTALQIREINPQTGAIIRSFASPASSSSGPDFGLAETANSLLVGGSSSLSLFELNLDTGAVIRTIPNPGIGVSGMAFLNNEIYVLTDSVAGQITVINYNTGAVVRTITAGTVSEALGASSTGLYGTSGTALYQINPLTGATTSLGTLATANTPEGLGILGNELYVAEFSQIGVYDLTTRAKVRTLSGLSDLEAIGADGGTIIPPDDFYSFTLNAGDTVVLRTSTPGDGSGEFVNTLDPALDLYNPSGAQITTDDNSGADGRNAEIVYTATATGVYKIRVYARGGTSGEYVLDLGNGMSVVLPADVSETAGSASGTITVPSAPASDLTISLTSSNPSRVSVPATIVVPAGLTSVALPLTILDNDLLDGPEAVTITATAAGYSSSARVITVHDDETGLLTIILPPSAREGDGPIEGLIVASNAPTRDLAVRLTSVTPGRATVPTSVILKAGQTSARFNLTVVDDAFFNGSEAVTVRADIDNWTGDATNIMVRDNDNFLVVTLAASGWEGQTLTGAGTVRIGGTSTAPLVVNLFSQDTSELTVPLTVTIPAGQTTATFTITLPTDALKDGSQTAMVTASASGVTDGSASMLVHDANLDHLAVDNISGPKTAGVAFSATARAFNIANELIAVYGNTANLSALGSSGTLAVAPTTATFSAGVWTGNVTITAVDPSAMLRIDAGGGIAANSNSFALQTGAVASFQWDTISSPQPQNPFGVTVTAKDASGFTVTGYNGTATISGLVGSGVNSSIAITEAFCGTPDFVEFTNTSNSAVNIGGWQAYIYDAESWPSPRATVFTFPSGTIVPAGGVFVLQETGTSPGTYPLFYTGENISWTSTTTSNVAVLLRNASSQIVDFFAAAAANPASIVSPTTIPATQWQGNQVAGITSDSNSYSRSGNQDHNSSTDWAPAPPTQGTKNASLTLPFPGGSTNVLISPVTANFVNGVWTGSITVLQAATGMYLRVEDGANHFGNSNTFNVIGPTAPAALDLLDASDSGFSSADNITNVNKSMQFQVAGTVVGATVTIYANGVPIGSAVATDTTTLITTSGASSLADGIYSFTARQTVSGQGQSTDSSALAVTIDATAPAAPAAPDLQTASDTGISTSDNITASKTPTFTIAGAPYFRFARNGVQIGGDYENGTSYTLATQTDGIYSFSVAGIDAAGNISPFSTALSVTIDNVAPRIIASSIPNGGSLLPQGNSGSSNVPADGFAPGSFTYSVTFSEPMPAGNLDVSDVTLLGVYKNATYTPATFAYSAGNTVLTLTYNVLPEDAYVLTLLSANGRFEDPAGNDLDGAPNLPVSPKPFGKRPAGANSVLNFSTDNTALQSFPTFSAKQPAGSLIYDSTVSGVIGASGDSDSYTLVLDAGQTLSVVVTPSATLRSKVIVRGPSGTLLGSATAPAAGGKLLLQNIPIAVAGICTITIVGPPRQPARTPSARPSMPPWKARTPAEHRTTRAPPRKASTAARCRWAATPRAPLSLGRPISPRESGRITIPSPLPRAIRFFSATGACRQPQSPRSRLRMPPAPRSRPQYPGRRISTDSFPASSFRQPAPITSLSTLHTDPHPISEPRDH